MYLNLRALGSGLPQTMMEQKHKIYATVIEEVETSGYQADVVQGEVSGRPE